MSLYVYVTTPDERAFRETGCNLNSFCIDRDYWDRLKPNDEEKIEGDYDMFYSLREMYDKCTVVIADMDHLEAVKKLGERATFLKYLEHIYNYNKREQERIRREELDKYVVIKHGDIPDMELSYGVFTVDGHEWVKLEQYFKDHNIDYEIVLRASKDDSVVKFIQKLGWDHYIKKVRNDKTDER